MQTEPGSYLLWNQIQIRIKDQNAQKFSFKLRNEHFASFKESDREAGGRSEVLAILVKPPLEFINNRAPKKRSGILRKPNAGFECVAILGIVIWKRRLEHNCQCFSNLSRDSIIGTDGRETGAAVADIARDIQSLLAYLSYRTNENC